MNHVLEQLIASLMVKSAPIKGNKEKIMSECYSCQHRREISGDAHSECVNPDTEMTGDLYGIKSGWFSYPLNFDPVWKTKECMNFLLKET